MFLNTKVHIMMCFYNPHIAQDAKSTSLLNYKVADASDQQARVGSE